MGQSLVKEDRMDSLLSDTDIEEALSTAYVHAVAAAAGYAVSLKNFDRDGVDMTIEAGGHRRPKIDLQVKATINLDIRDHVFRFALKRRNYDLLIPETQTPRLLVVLHLPLDKLYWADVGLDALVLKNCAYWTCLTGSPQTSNANSITIDIPATNRFSVTQLIRLMELSRTGALR